MGTVTLLFTDIEGSTRLLQQVGERYVGVLAECRQVLRTVATSVRAKLLGAAGRMALDWDDFERADALRDAIGAPLPPVYHTDYDRSVAAARAQLGEKAFATVWAEGRTMTPDQALIDRPKEIDQT